MKESSRRQLAQEAAAEAWEWICKRYQTTAAMPEFYLSNAARFPKFQRQERRVRIVAKRLKWGTYVKKRVGFFANWIPCTQYESWTLQFVHEFTHAIQADQKRRYSEVETTRNEIAFAKDHFPHLHAKITAIERVR